MTNMTKTLSSLFISKLRKIDITTHKLELLRGLTPAYMQPYQKKRTIKEEIEKNMATRVIKLTYSGESEWAAPVVLDPKLGGIWLFRFDYRNLNIMTKQEVYPLLSMIGFIDSLGEAKYFTSLDANDNANANCVY